MKLTCDDILEYQKELIHSVPDAESRDNLLHRFVKEYEPDIRVAIELLGRVRQIIIRMRTGL